MLTSLKFYLLVGCLWSIPMAMAAQENDRPNPTDLQEVSDIYVENLKPYLKKFSQALIPPALVGDKRESLAEAKYKIFLAKTEFVQKDAIAGLLKISPPKNTPETQWIIGAFAQVFMMEFPGLDYLYFEKCKSEATALMEKKRSLKK